MQEVVITGTNWSDLQNKAWIPDYSSGTGISGQKSISAYGKINGKAFVGGIYTDNTYLYISPQSGTSYSGLNMSSVYIQLSSITSFEIHLVPTAA